MRGKHPILLLTVLCALSAHFAGAGSLIEEQLATLKKISVTVLVPRYEPIPKASPDELERDLRSRVDAIVIRHDLTVSDSSQQNLLITVKAVRHGAGHGTLALLVLCELREPAVLSRAWGQSGKEELSVTSWRESRIVLASEHDVIEKLVEAVELAARDFAQDALQARRHRTRRKADGN